MTQVLIKMAILKLFVSMGSQKEYIFVHSRQKQITVFDLKSEVFRIFKIPLEQQFILFKGNNLHEYLDESPLDAFGLENNSCLSVWKKLKSNVSDFVLPRENSKTCSNDFIPAHSIMIENTNK